MSPSRLLPTPLPAPLPTPGTRPRTVLGKHVGRGGHAVALTMCLLDAERYAEAAVAFRAAARDHLFVPASRLPSSVAVPRTHPLLNPMLGFAWPRAQDSRQLW